jgi:hypothetical protein
MWRIEKRLTFQAEGAQYVSKEVGIGCMGLGDMNVLANSMRTFDVHYIYKSWVGVRIPT